MYRPYPDPCQANQLQKDIYEKKKNKTKQKKNKKTFMRQICRGEEKTLRKYSSSS